MRPVKTLNRPLWWLVFAIATADLSMFFQTFKAFTLVPNFENGMALLGVILILAAVMLVLGYDSYVKEKVKGNVHHPFKLFEWVYALQQAKMRDGGNAS